MTSPSKKPTKSHDVVHGLIGPLQLAILVVQNRHTGTQKSPWDKTNKGHYHFITMYCMSFVGLAPVRLLRPSMAVLYHVNGKLQRAYSEGANGFSMQLTDTWPTKQWSTEK